jgi:hypothetical protein
MEENKSEFNMVTDTLARLGDTLRKLQELGADQNVEHSIKQICKIGYVKQFFIQAVGLLSEEYVLKNKNKILSITSNDVKVFENVGFGITKNRGARAVFSSELDITLDLIMVDMLRDLRSNGFFTNKNKQDGNL